MRTVLVLIYLVFYFVLALPVLGVDWIIRKISPRTSALCQLHIVQWGFRCVSALSGIKLTVVGEENVPKDEAVLYVCNHHSFFDIVVTYARCPRPTGYISKASVDKVPVLGIIMRRLYCLFLDRDDPKQSMKVILAATDQVKKGISMCVFPEGTRNKDREHPESLLPFKDGVFKIAQKTGCPIVPMALIGTADIFENHFPWIHSQHVTLIYGKPIPTAGLSREEQKHLGARCQAVIHDMLVEAVNGK